ncbi:MAG: anion permease [bacterium]|nr:anion permease [bacterium]
MIAILPALYLGWGIGANDAANTFGPQIGANIIAYRRAIVLAAIFAFLGAVLEGEKVFPTLGRLTSLTLETSIIAAMAAGITTNVMTKLGLPISTSHAIFGALIAAGLYTGKGSDPTIAARMVASMMAAPIGAGVGAYLLHRLLAAVAAGRLGGGMLFGRAVRYSAVVVGCYAAYALGSNNVGNAMAPFVAVGVIGPAAGAALGGVAIAAGVLTYSRNVVMLVGKQITALDPITALVAALATAITVHLFTQLKIPVSTSQAIVGAVVGVGLTKGVVAVNRRMFWMIPAGWVISILGSGITGYLLMAGSGLLR